MKKIFLLLLLILLCQNAIVFAQNDYDIYVSTTGSDTYGNGTIEKPYKTIEKAKDIAKTMLFSGTQKNINVFLRGGNYNLDKAVLFDAFDSYNSSNIVTYQPFGNEKVIISGAEKITGWQKYKDNIYTANFEYNKEINGLYESDNVAYCARFPDKGERMSDGYLSTYGKLNDGRSGFIFSSGDFPKSDFEYIRTYIWEGGENGNNSYSMCTQNVSVDYDDNTVTFKGISKADSVLGAGSRYFMENAPEFLNQKGEYCVDYGNKKLYYIPYDEKNLNDIYIPITDCAIKIRGSENNCVKNLVFKNIIFMNFSGAGNGVVDVNYAENINVVDCEIKNSASKGVVLRSSNNSCVSGCKINNLGGGGVIVWDDDYKAQNNNRIENNLIYNVAQRFRAESGIAINGANDNFVTNNSIRNVPRAGISIGGKSRSGMINTVIDGQTVNDDNAAMFLTGKNNKIKYNDISRGMCDTQDGGLYYSHNAGENNEISGNFIHDSSVDFSSAWAVYLDDESSRQIVKNNIICNIYEDGGTLQQVFMIKGFENVIENNLIAFCKPSYGIFRVDSANTIYGEQITKNIAYKSGNVLFGFYSFYPQQIAQSDYNIFYDSKGEYKCVKRNNGKEYVDFVTLNEWKNQYGYDLNSKAQEPEFADSQGRNFVFAEGSIPQTLGINDFDISKAGTTKSFSFSVADDKLKQIFIKVNDKECEHLNLTQKEKCRIEVQTKTQFGLSPAFSYIKFRSLDEKTVSVSDKGEIEALNIGDCSVIVEVKYNREVLVKEIKISVR